VLLAIKQMGGESTEAWRTVLDDLVKPKFDTIVLKRLRFQ
jgi:hypothetical protein